MCQQGGRTAAVVAVENCTARVRSLILCGTVTIMWLTLKMLYYGRAKKTLCQLTKEAINANPIYKNVEF